MVNTKLEKLNLLDKFLFDEAMEDPEIYQAVVSILLENEVELLGKTETEKELRISPQLRQAQLDVSLLEPGSTDFNLLNESCFILIAPFDIFGRGLYRYTFEGRCRECPDLKLEDGATKVFINTKGKNREDFSREFLDFMEYIGNTTDDTAGNTGSGRIRRIHEKIKQIRRSEKAGIRIMQRWEELAYEREEGREEIRESLAEGFIEMAFEYGLPEEKILEKLQDKLRISLEKAEKYLSCYLNKAK